MTGSAAGFFFIYWRLCDNKEKRTKYGLESVAPVRFDYEEANLAE